MNPSSETAQTSKTPWALICVLLAVTTTSYIDRIAISVLAPTLRDEFGMTNSEYALVVNCFMFSYLVMYSVGGRLADILGFRRALSLYIVWWSVAGAAHGFSAGFKSLALSRFLLAVGEGGVWPAAIKAVAHRVQGSTRSLAVGIVNSGSSLGSALCVPLVGWLAVTWGWRPAFAVTGLMGFLLLPFWLSVTRGSQTSAPTPEKKSSSSWLKIIRYRQAWAPFVGRLISAGVWGFFAFWLPEYLSRERGLDLSEIAVMAWIPFVASAVGDLAGGGVVSWLVARGWTINRARKTVLCVSGVLASSGIVAVYSSSLWVVMTSLATGALFFKVASVNFLNLPADFFPASHVGTAFGFSGTGGSTGIFLTNAAIGWALDATGSYEAVLIGVSMMTPLAVLATLALSGKIERIATD